MWRDYMDENVMDESKIFNRYNNITGEAEKYESDDIYYLPIILTHDIIIGNCDSIIRKFSDGDDFISYKNASDCAYEIARLGDLTGLLIERKPEEGKAIIREMIDRMCHTGTDDDDFPISTIQYLFELIGEEKSPEEIFDMIEW